MRTLSALPVIVALVAACGGSGSRLDPGDTVSDEAAAEGPEGTDAGSSEVDSGGFPPDLPTACIEGCDIWSPDACPEGEKCTLAVCDSQSGDYNFACRDLHGDAGFGDECSYVDGDPSNGNDTCGSGLMCWSPDPQTGLGACRAFCQGSPEAPTCPQEHRCQLNDEGLPALCTPDCSPLEQDCPVEGMMCTLTYEGDAFGCADAAGAGLAPYGTPCQYVNACNIGLACVDALLVPEASCDGEVGCCSPFCSMSESGACPGAGQQCEPIVGLPEGYTDTGICALPS